MEERAQAGKRPSTIRHAYFVLKQVLDQAVADGRIPANPCDHVKLPTDRTATIAVGDSALAKAARRTPDGVVDPAQFLTAEQASMLVDATPCPYSVLVHVAAWSGLRAAELAGLQIGDVHLPLKIAANRPGSIDVQRTVLVKYGPIANPWSNAEPGAPEIVYDTTKTRGSRRRVPIPPGAVAVLRQYLAQHPYGPTRPADPASEPPTHIASGEPKPNPDCSPAAPLFPAFTLRKFKPTGVKAPVHKSGPRVGKAWSPAEQAARQTVESAQARLILDWSVPLTHRHFYGAVYRPAMLRANLSGARIAEQCTFHSLLHTYASLCIAAGIQPFMLSKFMGHANTNVTLGTYAHLFHDDHADAMAALGALSAPTGENVVRFGSR